MTVLVSAWKRVWKCHSLTNLVQNHDDYYVLCCLDLLLEKAAARGVKSVEIWSDNASHFHSTNALLDLRDLQKKFGIQIKRRFFEAGEGKSDLDRHFECLRRAINQYLLSGSELKGDLKDLLDALSERVRNTTVIEIPIPSSARKKPFVPYTRKLSIQKKKKRNHFVIRLELFFPR